jgi:hypothetical protein
LDLWHLIDGLGEVDAFGSEDGNANGGAIHRGDVELAGAGVVHLDEG